MQQAEITPTLFGSERPICPLCGTRMMLARINDLSGSPNHDERTFDCPNCGNETWEVVQFK
jgi:predicted RNA-binding Zn-ribbon protein involved in translation (DUF1610 family)